MLCSTCKNDLPEENFPWKNKLAGKRNSKCKSCHKEYVKEHYANNKKDYINRAKKNNKTYLIRNRNMYAELKTILKCQSCGENHPAVLDFHHTDPSIKEGNISRMVNRAVSKEKILKEIDKCIILCSNCHRKLHWNERNTPE